MRYALAIICALIAITTPATARAENCQPFGDPARETSLRGTSSMKTQPIDLTAGAYVVRWSAAASTQPAGNNLIMHIKRADGTYYDGGLVNLIIATGGPSVSGETFLYGVKPGQHYVDVMAPADWSVTISPL